MNICHLTAIISVVRHGEKDNTGELTEKGKRQAFTRGIKTQYLSGAIKLYSSGVSRVEKTVSIMGASLQQNTIDVVPNLPEDINSSVIPQTLEELHFELHLQDKSTYFSSWTDVDEKTEQLDKRVQQYLLKNDTSPEPGVALAPVTIAKRFARILAVQIKEAVATPYTETLNIINGTHEPVIMSFLFYALNDFKAGSDRFIKDIGGTVTYSEGFEIRVYQKEDGDFRCFLTFRGLLAEISLSDLQVFSMSQQEISQKESTKAIEKAIPTSNPYSVKKKM